MSKETTDKLFDKPDITPMLLNMLKSARVSGVTKSVQYRLFLAIKAKEALYDNAEIVAIKLSKGVKGLEDTVSDENLGLIAEELVGLFNDAYTTILKDVDNDKTIANKVLLEMVQNNQ